MVRAGEGDFAGRGLVAGGFQMMVVLRRVRRVAYCSGCSPVVCLVGNGLSWCD